MRVGRSLTVKCNAMLESLLDPGLKKNKYYRRKHSWDRQNNLNTDFTSDHIMEVLLIYMRNCLPEVIIKTSKFKI